MSISRQLVSLRLKRLFGPRQTGDPIRDAARQRDFKNRRVIVDSYYAALNLDTFQQFLELDPILKPPMYRENVFDCDDWIFYARTRMTLVAANNGFDNAPALGCLITKSHAFNFLIDEEGFLIVIDTASQEQRYAVAPEDIYSLTRINRSNPLRLMYI